jgi:hypothetical protein
MKTVAVEHPELHYEKLRRVFPAFAVQFLLMESIHDSCRWNEVDWTNPWTAVQKREA